MNKLLLNKFGTHFPEVDEMLGDRSLMAPIFKNVFLDQPFGERV